ncbi:MAG: VIT1/CCC1 family predicted Fe2+/Mn2+ transporter [Polyangiales bacterium]|jgi:VIT1/CCC1 family predicted Fe2+/Mn2+ transporter
MKRHSEGHYAGRSGWLRAAVLGANDGIVSTASLVIGVAAAGADSAEVMVAGVAGLVAGAMSMAAGEYVSVSSQADTERADLERERRELEDKPVEEHKELAAIYVDRGLEGPLAHKVAEQLMAHDALGAHARDELGLSHEHRARPVQAAFVSATTFAAGAAVPLVLALVSSAEVLLVAVSAGSLVALGAMGAMSGRAGGASVKKAAARVLLWGALAMAATAAVGALFGTVG